MNASLQARARSVRRTAWMPHAPTVKQAAALSLFANHFRPELLYGGAAGGGKSDFVLMAALQYVDVPGYSALVVRRTFPMLSQAGGMLPRAQAWLATKAHGTETIGGTPTKWIFPSGATLEFSHCQHDKDRFNFQGAEVQYLGLDEQTQFSEKIALYLTSRLRRPQDSEAALSRVPLRWRGATNPGGVGHDWNRQRFLVEKDLRRAFISSKLEDNPHIDREAYVEQLSQLHPYDRQQLLDGDWDARPPGSRFNREWFKVVDVLPVGRSWRRWDVAATEPKAGRDPDWTVGARGIVPRDGALDLVIADVQRFQGAPGEVDARVRHTAELDGRATTIRMEQEPGASGKIAIEHFRKLLRGFDFRGVLSTGDKVVRSNPYASAAFAGKVGIVRADWNETYLRELEMFPGGGHDDQVDASSGLYSDTTSRGVSPGDLYGGGENAESA